MKKSRLASMRSRISGEDENFAKKVEHLANLSTIAAPGIQLIKWVVKCVVGAIVAIAIAFGLAWTRGQSPSTPATAAPPTPTTRPAIPQISPPGEPSESPSAASNNPAGFPCLDAGSIAVSCQGPHAQQAIGPAPCNTSQVFEFAGVDPRLVLLSPRFSLTETTFQGTELCFLRSPEKLYGSLQSIALADAKKIWPFLWCANTGNIKGQTNCNSNHTIELFGDADSKNRCTQLAAQYMSNDSVPDVLNVNIYQVGKSRHCGISATGGNVLNGSVFNLGATAIPMA